MQVAVFDAQLTTRFGQVKSSNGVPVEDCSGEMSSPTPSPRDDRILEAFERSVHATMSLVERDMQTRVRKGPELTRTDPPGTSCTPRSRTTPPGLKGGEPDPHLHAHAFTFNATHDPVERQVEGWDSSGRSRLMPGTTRRRSTRTSRGTSTGLGMTSGGTPKAGSFTASQPGLVRKFSRRTSHIEARAEQLGLTYPEDKAALGAKTREPKRPTHSREELQRAWMARLTDAERQAFAKLRDAATPRSLPEYEFDHEDALNFAIDHSYERRSVLTDKELLEVALRRGLPFVTPDRLEEELDKRNDLIRVQRDGRELLTTPEVLAEEKAMIQYVRAGRGRLEPLAPNARAGQGLPE